MQAHNAPRKSSKGTVGIESFNGRLRLRLPRQWYGGKQKYLSLLLDDTPENRTIAEARVTQITVDYKLGQFDPSLDKYRPESHLTLVTPPVPTPKVTLAGLWAQYCEFKDSQWSPSTKFNQVAQVTRHTNKLPTQSLEDATVMRDWAMKNLSDNAAKRLITQWSACCNWAKKSGLISSNPFDGMAEDIKLAKGKNSEEWEITPFTRDERDAIIAAFKTNQFSRYKNDNTHSRYAAFVEFSFFTGCRPSEALGLQWRDITDRFILFERAVVLTGNGLIAKDGLKTQPSRRFPINAQLQAILDAIKPDNASPDDLVFTGHDGSLMKLHSFRTGAWKTVLKGLGIEYRTPYQTRHTFITLCLESGIDAKDVAKWVGNSPEIIYKHYAGNKRDLSVPEL